MYFFFVHSKKWPSGHNQHGSRQGRHEIRCAVGMEGGEMVRELLKDMFDGYFIIGVYDIVFLCAVRVFFVFFLILQFWGLTSLGLFRGVLLSKSV